MANIEYEAKFTNINKDEMRERLKNAGAKLVRAEYDQKRVTFNIPGDIEGVGKWVRVRDEGERITISYKETNNQEGAAIDEQKELMLVIDGFESACELLEKLGCEKKAFQESKREMWDLDDCEITIDEWPFLEPFVEIEGHSEDEVKSLSEKLGFDYSEAIFGSVSTLYHAKYNISHDRINNQTPEIKFSMENPFNN